MRPTKRLDTDDIKLAIELFDKHGYGIATIKRKIREKHNRCFCEHQIKRQLAEHGYTRNKEQAYEAKRKKHPTNERRIHG